MLSVEELKKIDPDLAGLTDAELEEVRAELYAVGQLAFDVWWTEESGSKNPVGSLPNSGSTA